LDSSGYATLTETDGDEAAAEVAIHFAAEAGEASGSRAAPVPAAA